jgi:hypothetical protein
MNDRMNDQARAGIKDQPIRINRKLNLVLQIDTEKKGTIHVHSVPISRAVFEEHFLAISRAYTAIYENRLDWMGPRLAKLMLLREAEAIGLGETERVKTILLPEIERLTNVLIPGERGWETLPYAAARNRGVIDEDAVIEIENALVFFTCASALHPQREFAVMVTGLQRFWGAATILSNVTEYRSSLPISTPAETTGEKPIPTAAAEASSIPT